MISSESDDGKANILAAHYGFLTSQAADRSLKHIDHFRYFVQLMAALVAGSIWLRHQVPPLDSRKESDYATLSDAVVFISTALLIVLIWDNFRSWSGYRIAQQKYAKHYEIEVPSPAGAGSAITEWAITLSAMLFAALFYRYNPFRP